MSLQRDIARAGTAVVLGTLSVVGVATGSVLHWVQVAALDESLLSAAHAAASPQEAERWEIEHSESPVRAWQVLPGDPRVPPRLAERAMRSERPVLDNVDGRRLLLVTAEPREDDPGAEAEGAHDERHRLIAASAPAARLSTTIGPFAMIYAGIAALAAALAGRVQARLTRAALAPLGRAEAEAASVVGLGQGARLTEAGPEELRGLLASMNAALERLDRAHAAQVRFTDQAAHELRTPVTVLRGELELALRAPRGAEELREVLVSAREEVGRIGELVEGLLTLARLDAGAAEAGREAVDAAELVAEALDRERRGLEAAACALDVEIEADPPLRAHRALCVSALSNLLRNAAAHAPGAPVRLRLRRDGALARFEVEDGGPGLPAELREAVFDRLHRGGRARRDDRGGLGLGLPLAREVARRHGGDCWLEAPPGGGCRAVLTIPSSAAEVTPGSRS